jgi:hypothetical protein
MGISPVAAPLPPKDNRTKVCFILSGVGLSVLVLQLLLAYCTGPG